MSAQQTEETSVPAETRSVDHASTDGALIRSLSATLPRGLGNLLATLVVLCTLVFGIWSLVATWAGTPDRALPLFQVIVAGTLVSVNALYARRTFSYVITLIGAILWILVSVTPFLPFWQVLLQAATVTLMAAGVVVSSAAVSLSKKPRF